MTAGHPTLPAKSEDDKRLAASTASPAPSPAGDDKTGFRAPLSRLEEALVEYLGKQPEPIYAVMDAARDAFIVPVIQAFAEEYRSLYEGEEGEKLAAWAPYLVRVKPGSRIAEELSHGWGKSWGIYLTCAQPLLDVRRHLRHFLTVETEPSKRMLFRFYDPRALRVFLPACNVAEVRQFFGPVGSFLVEDESPESVIRFRPGATGAEREVVTLIKPDRPK